MAAGLSRTGARLLAGLLCLLLPGAALGRKGSLAVVDLKGKEPQTVQAVTAPLRPHVGGWAGQPDIAAYLAGNSDTTGLPAGATGEELVRLVGRIRAGGTPVVADLGRLGQLLAVDYLLLLKVGKKRLSARLFSVPKQAYSPRGFEGEVTDKEKLKTYVLDQSGQKAGAKKSKKRWWIWAIAGALAVAGVVLALTLTDDSKGDLKVRVSR